MEYLGLSAGFRGIYSEKYATWATLTFGLFQRGATSSRLTLKMGENVLELAV
jgi:hypothetical protein